MAEPGFSLIEVVLALALAATALLGVLSLLPQGLKTFRTSMDTAVAAQISQRLVEEFHETDFDRLLPQAGELVTATGFFALPRRFFDEQGKELPVSDPEHPTTEELRLAIYEVRTRGSLPGAADPTQHRAQFPTALPADETSAAPYNPRDLLGLIFQIAQNPTHRDLPEDPANPLLWKTPEDGGAGTVQIHTYSAVVARHGSP